MSIGLAKAKAMDADIVLGTDPDADRVGVGVKNHKGDWVLMNGNQTAVLAFAYMMEARKAKAEPPLSEAARPEVVHAAAAAEPHLVVSRSSTLAVGTTYDVAGGATIGRSRGSRIPITDQFISTSHARVFRKGHFWFVEDLGSLNGTYVNGRRISGEQQLHLRDEIRVGETVLRWEE